MKTLLTSISFSLSTFIVVQPTGVYTGNFSNKLKTGPIKGNKNDT